MRPHKSLYKITVFMRPTPFYFFLYLPPGARKPKRTTYRMTIEDAAVRLPGAWPDELSKEIRNLPDDTDLVNGGLGFLATPAPMGAPETKKPPPPEGGGGVSGPGKT
jgi:hypothetical protein